jgi:hypothetical protein
MEWKEGRESDQISVISVQTPRFLLTLYIGCAVYLRRMRRSIGSKASESSFEVSHLFDWTVTVVGLGLQWDYGQEIGEEGISSWNVRHGDNRRLTSLYATGLRPQHLFLVYPDPASHTISTG